MGKKFGGAQTDFIQDVQQTMDGGYILCGGNRSQIPDSLVMWLIKTDADGIEIWQKTFSGKGASMGTAVQQTLDGDYIVCGSTKSDSPNTDEVLMVKIDANGEKLWENIFMSKGPSVGWSVRQTADGGYIVCGDVWAPWAKVFLMKFDANGSKLWDETFGSDDAVEYGSSVQQTVDNGYVICGTAAYPGSDKPYALLIKTDANGNKLWDHKLKDAAWNSIQQTMDGGYILCGSKISHDLRDVFILKMAPER